MHKTIVTGSVLALVLVLVGPAEAQPRSGVGIGIETNLGGELPVTGVAPLPGAVTLTYDTGSLYAGGSLTFLNIDDSATVFAIGGRGYFPIHDGDRSDFALGGGFTIINTDFNAGESDTSFLIELGGRLRAFLTANVALSAGVGIGILVADSGGPPPDDNAVGLLGNLTGSAGISYFFW